MNQLKIYILEANARKHKIAKLQEQLKQEEKELQIIHNYIVKEMQQYPCDKHGDRKIKLVTGGREILLDLDITGKFDVIREVISL